MACGGVRPTRAFAVVDVRTCLSAVFGVLAGCPSEAKWMRGDTAAKQAPISDLARLHGERTLNFGAASRQEAVHRVSCVDWGRAGLARSCSGGGVAVGWHRA